MSLHGDEGLPALEAVTAAALPEETLRRFARELASTVLHLWIPPLPVLQYLEAGDERIRPAAYLAAVRAAAEAAVVPERSSMIGPARAAALAARAAACAASPDGDHCVEGTINAVAWAKVAASNAKEPAVVAAAAKAEARKALAALGERAA